MSIKRKRANDGIREFVLRAFDYDNNVIGRFDDQHTGNLALRHQTCPNGTSVSRIDRSRTNNIHARACLGDLHGSSGKSGLSRDSGRLACNGCSFESRSNRLPVRCFALVIYRALIASFQCGHRFQSPTLSSEISAIDTCKKPRNWIWSVISLLF